MFTTSRTLSTFSRIACLLALALCVSMPGLASASDGDEGMDDSFALSEKEQWQSDYRRLLQEQARLERNAQDARENYSQARLRSYPRGAARAQFLVDEAEALKQLDVVRAEIEKFKLDSRRDGVLPGWVYEVEEEPLAAPQPAAKADEEPEDREGRNPLYLDSE